MIHLTKGQTENIVLTLTEKATLTSPNWLFIFKSRVTNETVSFVVLGNSDLSNYTDRFNSFNIVVNTNFATKTSGEYTYTIYEQASSSNTNPANATGIVEVGQMTLKDATDFSFTSYTNATNTYKVRDI
jgi:hypothetical protein